MTDLVDIVVLHAANGKSDQLGRALATLTDQSRKEPGCAVCEVNQSRSEPNMWMVYERWRGQEALDQHMKQPYVARFLELMGPLVDHPPEVRQFDYRGAK